jgi:hypothetical protein
MQISRKPHRHRFVCASEKWPQQQGRLYEASLLSGKESIECAKRHRREPNRFDITTSVERVNLRMAREGKDYPWGERFGNSMSFLDDSALSPCIFAHSNR